MTLKLHVPPGHEIRGFRVRLYPTPEQVNRLVELEAEARKIWNQLCSLGENTWRANCAFAVRAGLIAPPPERPNYDGLDPADAKAAKISYKECVGKWAAAAYKVTKADPRCSWRGLRQVIEQSGHKYDYQVLRSTYFDHAVENLPSVHWYQALARNFGQKAARRKKFRRSGDRMPLQVRTGACYVPGCFGSRGKNSEFYNCMIKFEHLEIRGRLPGKFPAGRVLEGVTIRREADGWWASIKVEQPIRVLPPATPGSVVGIDLGLTTLAAISDGTPGPCKIIENPRGTEYVERIAGRRAEGKPTGRLEQRAARNVRHVWYNVLKSLETVEVVKFERLTSRIGQMGSSKTSYMRQAYAIALDRLPGRVREVDPRYTSQRCSKCGEISKETWSYDIGRIGSCPFCGHKEHRDANAARNIANSPTI